MAMLSDEDKSELLRLAGSDAFWKDMEHVSALRHNPVLVWRNDRKTDKVDWRMQDRVPKIDKKTGKQKIGKFGPEWDDLPNDQYACSITACKTPAFDDERPRRTKPKADPGLKPWQPLMKGLLDRQTAFVVTYPDESILRLDAIAVSPFTTGLGNEHPLENGFAFLNPYGLPYLPGSGVKGVLRRAARELASGDWGDAKGWTEDKNYSMCIDDETVNYSMLDALFGLESDEGETVHIRGALFFGMLSPKSRTTAL